MSFAAPAASCPSCQAWTIALTAAASQSSTEPVRRGRIVLFDDGTFNNSFNTAARKAGGLERAMRCTAFSTAATSPWAAQS